MITEMELQGLLGYIEGCKLGYEDIIRVLSGHDDEKERIDILNIRIEVLESILTHYNAKIKRGKS